MKKFKLLTTVILVISVSLLYAQKQPGDKIQFSEKEVKFDKYPGLIFRSSDPYLRYQKWDSEHTGDAWFSIALEFVNKSEKPVSSMLFKVKLYDKKGNIVYEGTSGVGPMTFVPSAGNRLNPGYKGVYDAFVSRDKDFFKKYHKIKYEISEVNFVDTSLPDKPEFIDESITFDEFKGFEFQLSKPYMLIDDLSGNELFAIAMKFKNASGKTLKSMKFKANVFDDIGILVEREIQEHNQKYSPEPKNFMDPNFPVDYEGVNVKFFIYEKSLFKKFKKIEIKLLSVE